MLSIENLPPDPSSQISLLKSSSSSSHERPSISSDNNKLDLSNSDLDDNTINQLPKFSIRDYVFRTRRKDIKTNWPFSQKNLQLCLKHGVTDLLPPFQAVKGCAVDDIVTSEKEHVKLDDDPVLTSSSSARCMPKLAADYRNISSSGSDREKVLQSTTTSQSCSEIDSVPATERNPCSRVEAVTLLEPLVGKTEGKIRLPPMKNKGVISTTQPPAKKSRLVVKLGNFTDRTVEEDTNTANNFMVSEAMASKVCPVCKTFSSSSNTTLNAHIDQCLSGESTIKWTTNSKVIKHRIKPRKTRLMVDIYETAVCCTLEDLDRRNGTNWASNLSFAVRETEVSAVKKLENPTPDSLQCTGNEGAVYIDSNGTKVRILSKFNDEQSPSSKYSKLVNGPHQKNVVGDKRSKFILTKKSKKKNQYKLLKSAPQTKKFSLSNPYGCPKIKSGEESTFSPKENVDKEDCPRKHLRSPDQLLSNGLGTIKQWACSKRTGLTRKISDKDNHQLSGGDLLTGVQNHSDLLPLTDSFMKRSCLLKSPRSSAKTVCLPESSHGMGDMFLEPQDEHSEEPSLQKKVDVSSSRSQFPSNKKRSPVLQKSKAKHLKVDGDSVKDSFGDPPKITVDHALSVKNMKIRSNTDLLENTSEINCKLSTSNLAFSSKARKFSPLKKNLLSVGEGAAHGVKCNLKWKTVSREKSSMRFTSESEEAGVYQTEGEKQCLRGNLTETEVQASKSCDRVIVNRSRVLNIRKTKEGVVVSNMEDTTDLKSSQFSAEIHSDNDSGSTLAGASDAMRSVKEPLQTQNDKTLVPAASEFASGGDFMSLSKSLDAGSDEFSGPSGSHCDSKLFDEEYQGSFLGTKAATSSQDPISAVDEGMLSAVEIGKSMIDQNVHDATEFGSDDGQGNYFMEVDPIPIPGPPGSFLPSPGRMSSEDLHGSSSLTGSRIQSSADHPGFLDQDSSGSPTSAASTVSNSTMARTGSRYSEKLSIGGKERLSHTGWEEKRSSFSGSNVDLLVESSVTLLQTANGGEDSDGLNKFNVNSFFPGKGTFRFSNDKPCCCVRKEGGSQGFALNREESQLLQRRAMAPSPLPANENQLSRDSIRRPKNIILKSNSFSLSDSSSGPETNGTNSSVGHSQFGMSADSDFKLRTRDSESFSPSASNPVLRLMGKDLMVVNKDEDSPLKRSSHSNSMNDLANTRLPGVSFGSFRSEDLHSFCQVDTNNRLVSHLPQSGDPVEHFDVRLLNGFRSHDSYIRPQQPSPTSPVSFSCKSSGSGLMGGSFGRHDNIIGCNLHTVQNEPKETCDMKMFTATPISHWQNATSAENVVKEIIVIDDSPEDGANSATDAAHTMGIGKSKSLTSIQMQMASAYTSRFVNFSENRQRGSPYSGSGAAQNANLATQVNEIPAKWNGNPEVCSLVRPSSFSASSSPAGLFRSPLYYSPGFS